jgi:MFS family permease
MDASSELVHSLLPVFMTTVLGASVATVGLIEGIAESSASLAKVVSGIASDRLGRRKPLVLAGYGLAALSKPIFPLATSVAWVLTGRFVDRIGKGIRGAPRDALVADITPPEHRGAAYGLRQALDSAGAVIGPLLAIVLMALLHDDIRTVLWAAVIPAAMAVLLVAVAVREPPRPSAPANGHARLTTAAIAQLPRACWLVVLLGAVFTLARFSEAFLILRAQDVGLRLAYVPAVLIVMNVVYAGTAYPAGWAADRVSRRALLVAGLAVLVGGDVVLAFAATPTHVLAGVACWGLHMGLTQGLMAKLVADTAPPRLRGTAFGLFNLAAGAALLLASAIAGSLWSTLGPGATFIGGALVAALAAAGVLAYQPRPRRAP